MDPNETPQPSEARAERPKEAPQLVSCVWCMRLHPGRFPLSVCPRCAAGETTLQSLEMSGSFPLSNAAIDAALTRIAPGNYALGYLDGESFQVFYVGRADSDLRQRLHEWVGMPSGPGTAAPAHQAPWATAAQAALPFGRPTSGRVSSGESAYTRFAYSYAASPEDAFEKEARNYDAFGTCGALDNECGPSPGV